MSSPGSVLPPGAVLQRWTYGFAASFGLVAASAFGGMAATPEQPPALVREVCGAGLASEAATAVSILQSRAGNFVVTPVRMPPRSHRPGQVGRSNRISAHLDGARIKRAAKQTPLIVSDDPSPEPQYITTPDERRETLNGMGYEARNWDPITLAFAETPLHSKTPVLLLDVGCGFGRVARAAANNGAMVMANDLDLRHLAKLREESDPRLWRQFLFHTGNFLENFPVQFEAFDAILVSRMVHFLAPGEFLQLLRQARKLLLPGGRLYITASSPYVKSFRSFLPTYESRRDAGFAWPGYIPGRGRETVQRYFVEAGNRYPARINLFDPAVMDRALLRTGFRLEQPARWMPNPDRPEEHALDGRELVGAVAYK